MFYILKSDYVGPNQEQHKNSTKFFVQTVPGQTNSSHEDRTSGWLGTTNDWSLHAYGESETLDEAKSKISELCDGKFREIEPEEHDSYYNDGRDDVCLTPYKYMVLAGAYEELNGEGSANFAWEGSRQDITADTTDERIAELVKGYEELANGENATLDASAVEQVLKDRRNELLAKREESE